MKPKRVAVIFVLMVCAAPLTEAAFFKSIVRSVKSGVSKAAGTVKSGVEKAAGAVKTTVEKGAGTVKTGVEKGVDAIKTGVVKGIGAIGDEVFNKQGPSHIRIEFHLYTRRNRNNEQRIISVQNKYKEYTNSILASNYDRRKKTKFIIHGYNSDAKKSWVLDLKNVLLDKGDVNVIAVNWKKGADSFVYYQSARNTETVGQLAAGFIRELNTPLKDVHVIGHSLGAHAAGYTGANLRGLLGRISGLDPAGPYFNDKSASKRLDKNDALLVDVIHTDGPTKAKAGLGANTAMGDVDFYPNGGKVQPGCKKDAGDVLKRIFTGKYFSIKNIAKEAVCNHNRAVYIYIDSLRNSYRNCNNMGYDAYKSSGTRYSPRTASSPPYCR